MLASDIFFETALGDAVPIPHQASRPERPRDRRNVYW